MTEIFPVTLRQPGVIGPSPAVSVGGVAAGKRYKVFADIALADREDATVRFTIEVQLRKLDLSWPSHVNSAITFQGGPNMGKGDTDTPTGGWRIPGDIVANRDVRFLLRILGRAVLLGLSADEVT